jgi:hypothetical protein
MYQTYAGKVCNGLPVVTEAVTLPENARLIITVLDTISAEETKTQKQLSDLNSFIAANKALDKKGIEPLDDELFFNRK